MSDNSSIEWCDATWPVVTGCSWHSRGCDHCYAAGQSARLAAMGQEAYVGITVKMNAKQLAKGLGSRGVHFNGKIKLHDDRMDWPRRWKKPRTIFVCSMSDLFHEDVPAHFIRKALAIMSLCPQHRFLVLTKRPERMRVILGEKGIAEDVAWNANQILGQSHLGESVAWPLRNLGLGVSIEDQTQMRRAYDLVLCPAAMRFLSIEPLLGPVTLNRAELLDHLHWVIVGGESGPGARPMHLQWARSLRDQCWAAGVPFFFKQWGAYRPVGAFGSDAVRCIGRSDERRRRRFVVRPLEEPHNGLYDGSAMVMEPVGKKRAGRELDGRIHDAFPSEFMVAARREPLGEGS